MKSNFQKLKQRLRFIEIFGIFLMKDLKNIQIVSETYIKTSSNDLDIFLNIYVSALNNFAPRKEKYSRGNNMSFMNLPLKKAQMKRDVTTYNRQYDYCVSLLQKTKKEYCANLNKKDIAGNQQF